jgi:hypothetical protein
MKANLLKDFTSLHQKVGEEEVDHTKDGRTNSDFNLGVGRV